VQVPDLPTLRSPRQLAVIAASACLAVLGFSQQASAAVTCTVDSGGTRLVIAGDGDSVPVIVRSGDAVLVLSSSQAQLFGRRAPGGQVPCAGPAPTVTTLDLIEINESDGAAIALSGGPLAPGASGEADAPEIEITVNDVSHVTVLGSAGPDRFAVSNTRTESDTGLNAGEDSDPDLVLRGDYVSTPLLFGGPGDDVIDCVTGPLCGGFGGTGNDLISGAPHSLGFFTGGAGNDTIVGDSGDDIAVGGPGRDLLIGGKGDDGLNGAGGGRDRIRCGPGHDLYGADRRDRRKSCERDFKDVERPKLPKLP